ncbi:MAG TPA: dienelactone hydrolase family protein [Vicinamibacterales bacterium]
MNYRAVAAVASVAIGLEAAACSRPTVETVSVHSGSLTLRALVWRPEGRGPFPAVLFNHGSGRTPADLATLGPYEQNAFVLGPVFAHHGYVFMYLFRRGVGMSSDQGVSSVDTMARAQTEHGVEARNTLQLRRLDGPDLDDARSGLASLRGRVDVDRSAITLVGHSFGASLTLLMGAREPDLRAIVVFSPAGYSWDRSAELRARLLAAAGQIACPVLVVHAANDYSVAPGQALDAELSRLGRPHQLRIFPANGSTPDEGHDFVNRAPGAWERDVFSFLSHPSE